MKKNVVVLEEAASDIEWGTDFYDAIEILKGETPFMRNPITLTPFITPYSRTPLDQC